MKNKTYIINILLTGTIVIFAIIIMVIIGKSIEPSNNIKPVNYEVFKAQINHLLLVNDSLININDSLIKDNEVKTRMILFLNDQIISLEIKNEKLEN